MYAIKNRAASIFSTSYSTPTVSTHSCIGMRGGLFWLEDEEARTLPEEDETFDDVVPFPLTVVPFADAT